MSSPLHPLPCTTARECGPIGLKSLIPGIYTSTRAYRRAKKRGGREKACFWGCLNGRSERAAFGCQKVSGLVTVSPCGSPTGMGRETGHGSNRREGGSDTQESYPPQNV